MKKTLIALTLASTLSFVGAMPVLAAADAACVKTALTKREDGLVAEFDKLFATIKSARETRKAELLAAWDLPDQTRKQAVESAWSKYKAAATNAWSTWRTARRALWATYKNERATCGVAIQKVILTPLKTQVKPGEEFLVRWEVERGTVTAKDWIAMAPAAYPRDKAWSAGTSDIKEFFYTDAKVAGTKLLKATTTPGTYVLRYYENDTWQLKTQGTTTIIVAP